MKIKLRDCLRLKPFDEKSDALIANDVYAASMILSAAIVAGACLGIASLALAIVAHPQASRVLAAAVAISAITAGFEWHAGLRARSLNQLFATVVITLGFCFLDNILVDKLARVLSHRQF